MEEDKGPFISGQVEMEPENVEEETNPVKASHDVTLVHFTYFILNTIYTLLLGTAYLARVS